MPKRTPPTQLPRIPTHTAAVSARKARAEAEEARLYDQGYDRGHSDGYAGNAVASLFGHPRATQDAYREGYAQGQADYRRTLEEPRPRR